MMKHLCYDSEQRALGVFLFQQSVSLTVNDAPAPKERHQVTPLLRNRLD